VSREKDTLHRISQARNKRNAPGTDEVLKDCDSLIREYGDLVDSHCTKNIDELHGQIAEMATKLTVADDEKTADVLTIVYLKGQIDHLDDEICGLNHRIVKFKEKGVKPKRKRRTKAQMATAKAKLKKANKDFDGALSGVVDVGKANKASIAADDAIKEIALAATISI